MTELGQLLEIPHDSRGRWRTFRGEYRLWRHRQRSHDAFTEKAERSGGTTYGALAVSRKGDTDPEPVESEGRWRIWINRPESIREEFEGRGWGGPRTTVKVGERWWTFDEHWGAQSNEGSEDVTTSVAQFSGWLEPAGLLGSLRFEPLGRTTVARREALLARATPPEKTSIDNDGLDWELHRLGAEAEEYELAVDLESGILLKVEARFGGEPFLIGEAELVAFDEELPPETFVFTAPEGEEIQPLDFARPRMDQPIHEAAADASFTVFILPRIPEGWRMYVHSTPASKRPSRPPYVGVSYLADGGVAGLELSQRAHSGDAVEEYEGAYEFEDVEHSGIKMKVRHRADDLPQALVLVTREGTDLTINSDELDGDKLVEIAASLVPAPTASPEF